MIFENTGLDGIKSDLAYLDESAEKVGFVRWQWEYYRATYDYKIEDNNSEYFLRINTRALEGKLERPDTVLAIEAVYMGRATFPHGLEYESPIPSQVLSKANQKLTELKKLLEA
ncbi:YugN family protein [Paenibacillus sp. YPG26]|uniref:YugN family protein n=1 Tax=Paenibacillus sp. YPG26 TaxID=2878915 RepID=UPI0020412249|nr:YugN family protein [Paenibacillus sp. YPG26]USB34592.1 YugN-like family protein [Paenibacillus sp. YPG26]